jgi:outer membrane protein OmpA-like peptidoglycan-associated protein
MRKIIICIAACFALPAFSQQQEILPKQQNRHEFFLEGGGGISALRQDISAASGQIEFNYRAGLGYTYFFNYNWGLSIGGEFSFLPIGAEIDPLTNQSLVEDISFDYYQVEGSNLTEKQEFYYVNIPLMARYQVDLPSKSLKLYFAAGPKLGIPIKNSFHTQGMLTTSGRDIPGSGSTRDPLENMPNHGFYPSYTVDYQGEYKKKIYISGALEAGIKYAINRNFGLYAGLYADCGLNDIVDRSDAQYSDYTGYNLREPAKPVINSILTSSYGRVTAENGGIKYATPFVKRANTVSLGLKLGLTFGIDPINKKEKPVKLEQKEPYEGLTEAQLQKVLAGKTNDLILAQQKEFQDLKDFLDREKEQPDLSATIYCFDFDRDNIPDNMKAILDNKAQLLKEYPRVNLVLEGHTDQAGGDQYNIELGLKRAEAVKFYLISKGIGSNRLTVTSKGKSAPVASGIDEQARCRNRRVEFLINCSLSNFR